MGLFDKIKDNAKNISMRALYEEVPDATNPDSPVVVTPLTEEVLDFEDRPIEASDEKPTESEKAETDTDKDAKDEKVEVKSDKSSEKSGEKIGVKRAATVKPTVKKPAPVAKKVEFSPVTITGKAKVIDVAPQRGVLDPARKSLYARERAALVALAARRRMDGTVPLYTTNHQTFRTRIFIDRIEYSGSFGKNVLPIEHVAWIKLRAGGTGVIIETTQGKRVVMVVKPKDRLAFADAVMKVQSMQPKRVKFKDTQTIRIDKLDKIGEGVDEIEKLSKLFDKGIISQEEFDAKKKQILGI